jgi:5-formyltetrahydrofolate cyclo-ligase
MRTSDRKELRKYYSSLRASLTPSTCQAHSQAITAHIMRQPFFVQAKSLAFYQAINGEIDLTPLLLHALNIGKECYLPCIAKEDVILHFRLYDCKTPMHKNHYGIAEPDPQSPLCSAENLDVVFTPLVAFDQHGHRLGMGAGYYDRTFAFLHQATNPKPWLVGVAHALQSAPSIPSATWDVPLHAIVTENGPLGFHPLFTNWVE